MNLDAASRMVFVIVFMSGFLLFSMFTDVKESVCIVILFPWCFLVLCVDYSSVMFSGGVQPVIIVRRRHEIIINLCVSHFG